jgi:hypothetical protein
VAPAVDDHGAGPGVHEAGAQSADVAYDGPSADLLASPDAAREFVFAEDSDWVADERGQQLEYQWAEVHDRSGDLDAACGQVDVDRTDVQVPAGDGL